MEAAIRRLDWPELCQRSAFLALLAVQALPVLAGLAFLVMPAFGYFPTIGQHTWSATPWIEALGEPGLRTSVAATLISGIPATLVSLCLALALASWLAPWGDIARPGAKGIRLALQSVVAVPPAALGIGLAFVVAPSGWVARFLQPILDWPRPPDWPLPHDRWGLALCLGLILKETPFLTLAALAALHQMRPRSAIMSAIGLGYEPAMAWIKVVLPSLLARLRWPIFAVLAYSLTAVDIAVLLGPTAPSTLSVLIVDLGRDPDLSRRLPAAALTMLQIGLVLCAWACWSLVSDTIRRAFAAWRIAGLRELPIQWRALARAIAVSCLMAGAVVVAASLIALPLWSLGDVWRYPAILPECCSLAHWQRSADTMLGPVLASLYLAMAATLMALASAVLYLRVAASFPASLGKWGWAVIFLPLVTPDIGFLMGAQILLLWIGWRSGMFPVLWMHFLFVFPYVLLVMADAWRELDPRYERIAACLGASPWRQFVRVRLALLRPDMLLALALGVAVSLSLYLPTVLMGAGRVETLATQAVALSAGGDRRITGVLGTMQTAIAWGFFAWAALAGRRGYRRVLD